MNREYHKWFSPVLQRTMELLVFGHSGKAVLFFPTRTARFYDYENWGVISALSEKIDNGELQIFCVDSVDAESFYNDAIRPAQRIIRHLAYEQYILDEVLPFIHYKNRSGYIEVAGCSMGAYHAVNLGLKYPRLFKKIVGMSGRYDLTQAPGNFRDLFDGFHNKTIYLNMPEQYVSNLTDQNILNALKKVEIILAVGEEDLFSVSNKIVSDELWAKGVPNELYLWKDEAHRPKHWRQMVQWYL